MKISKRHLGYLKRWEDGMRTVDQKRLNMGSWACSHFDPNHCETVACAAGWATVLVPEAGLRLKQVTDDTMVIVFDDTHGTSAVAKAFGLSNDDACDICYQDSYRNPDNITPRQVANAIGRVIDKLEK
jgi:hypothetical protein